MIYPRSLIFLIPLAVLLIAETGEAAVDRSPQRFEILVPREKHVDLIGWGRWLVAADETGGIVLHDPVTHEEDWLNTTRGLNSHRMSSLLVDNQGDLWTASVGGGIVRFDPDLNSRAITGLLSLDVTALAVDGDFIWYGTPVGAGRIVNGLPDLTLTSQDDLVGESIVACAAGNDLAWLSSSEGVSIFDRQLNAVVDGNAGLGADRELLDFQWVDGELFAASRVGVYVWNAITESWQGQGLAASVVALGEVSGDLLALDTVGNVHRRNAGSWTNLGNPGDSELRLLEVVGDASGEIWLAGSRVENDRIGKDPLAMLKRVSDGREWLVRGLFGNNARGIAPDGNGGAWVGTFPVRDGMSHWTPDGQFSAYNYLEENPNGTGLPGWREQGVRNHVFLDSRGDIWCATLNWGLTRLRPHSSDNPLQGDFLHLEGGAANPLKSRRMLRIAESPAGHLWFLSDGGNGLDPVLNAGVDILVDPADPENPASWLKITPSNSLLGAPAVADVAFDGDDVAIFLVPGIGIQRWDYRQSSGPGAPEGSTFQEQSRWDTVSELSLVDLTTASAIEALSDGSWWVATNGSGILHIRWPLGGTEFRALDRVRGGPGEGMVSGGVRDLAVSAADELFVATDAGLQRVVGTGSDLEIDLWTDLATFFDRDLGREYLPEVISPLPGANLYTLAYSRVGNRLLVGGVTGAAVLTLDGLDPPPSTNFKASVWPNPFRGGDGIRVDGFLGLATVEVYNLQGTLLARRTQIRPAVDVAWDVRDQAGLPVASGLYLLRILQDGNKVGQLIVAVER